MADLSHATVEGTCDENRRAVGMLKSLCDKNGSTSRDDTCERARLVQNAAGGMQNLLQVELESKNDNK